jgi:hypothetical protein
MSKWLLLCVLALSTVACGGTPDQIVKTDGVVKADLNLEGGWWYIEAPTGEQYTPFPMPEAFKVQGMAVRVSMVLLQDWASYYPGTYVRIVAIEQLAVGAGG